MSLLFPAGLLLSLLAIPIVALYFLRIRRKKVAVSSLMLWHALQRSERLASPFHRFKRHLLLLLQLLLLAALVLALARPYRQTSITANRSIVLVFDTSASMGATDGDPTRLASAIAQADDLLADFASTDEVMVIEAGARTGVLLPFTRDSGRARSLIATLEPSEAEGSLFEGLQLAISLGRSRAELEVVLLSDGGNEDLAALPNTPATLTYLRMGRSDRNSGILALDLRRSPANELDRQLFVTVQNFGSDATQGSVELYLDEELIGLRNERLSPDVPVSMVFDVDGSRSGILRAELHVDDDILAADDRAFAVLGRASARQVLLVDGDGMTARVLAADPRVELQRTSTPTKAQLTAADAILFGGDLPPDLDGLDYAVLSGAGGPAELGDPVDLPRILGWQRTHPTLRFVDLQGATVARSRSVGNLNGLLPIVDGDRGPLVLAGERQGGRVVQLTFDPFQSDLPMRVAWPVFVLNTVGWLTERSVAGSEAALLPAGAPYLRQTTEPGLTSATIRGPGGTSDVPIEQGRIRFTDTGQVGIYRVSAGSLSTSFATNLLSDRESRVAPLRSVRFGNQTDTVEQSAASMGRQELWRPLLILALLLLCLEWFAWSRRRTA